MCSFVFIGGHQQGEQASAQFSGFSDQEKPCFSKIIDQFVRGGNDLFNEMCQEFGVKKHIDKKSRNILSRRTVTKQKMAIWFEYLSYTYMLNNFAALHIECV